MAVGAAKRMRNVVVNNCHCTRLALGWRIAAAALLWLQAITVLGSDLREANLQPIDDIVNREVELGNIPGAVVLIGHQGKAVYRRAFGYRALEPQRVPMTEDTIFDLASLTKVIATSTAVMQLVKQGKLRLDDSVANHWPAFGSNGKKQIRVRELLNHSSGLRAGLNLRSPWSGYGNALQRIAAERPVLSPGKSFLYSDINFIVLGELVKRVSGLSLELYCARHLFTKLRMKDTGFRPSASQRDRIAPTVYRNGKMLWGEVHDPTAQRMGGVSGHAGLFSTADDLALFAQMLLNGGNGGRSQILSPASLEEMMAPRGNRNGAGWRGLGWEIEAPFAANRDDLPPVGAFGHTGYTGTSIWIDPTSKTYVIILTNRVHPHGSGDVKPLRTHIREFISAVLGPLSISQVLNRQPALGAQKQDVSGGGLQSGVDVLVTEKFAPLAGLRVGLISNHTGTDSEGRRTLDLLVNAPGLKLAALFSPEHGLYGDADDSVPSGTEPGTRLPVYSLYGDVRRPTKEMLEGLDALVFDIQDAGARFYTYVTTMAYAMEAAAKKGLGFYVLDRPNPINASVVQGPTLDADLRSFTGYFPLPVRYGMTVGELATMFNSEAKIGAKLHIVKMRRYRRSAWYDETGLRWVGPSPNLPTLTAATLYPGVAMVEGANLSVGRGTEAPFELLGAPWINGIELATYLNERKIQGVWFIATSFMPAAGRYKNQVCHGVRIVLVDRNNLDAPVLGIEIASALRRLYASDFQLEKTLGLIGARWVVQAIKEGSDARTIAQRWEASLEEFRKLRAKYLLYSSPSVD